MSGMTCINEQENPHGARKAMGPSSPAEHANLEILAENMKNSFKSPVEMYRKPLTYLTSRQTKSSMIEAMIVLTQFHSLATRLKV